MADCTNAPLCVLPEGHNGQCTSTPMAVDMSPDHATPHDDHEEVKLWSYGGQGIWCWAWRCRHGWHFSNFRSATEAVEHMARHIGGQQEADDDR